MDPLQELLDLEEQYYAEGYTLGVKDGDAAGRAEGRLFGMQKAFERFREIGQLSGRTNCIKCSVEHRQNPTLTSRAMKHLEKLLELTDIETLPTDNSDDAVDEVDERLRDARAKALLISKMTGKKPSSSTMPKRTGEIEDFIGVGKRTGTSSG